MRDLQFPIKLVFNVSTFSNDFSATDANGQIVAYVKQKLFKLKEDVSVFNNDTIGADIAYKIKADRWIDFSAAYSLQYSDGTELGKVARKGWRSIWKASYEIIDQNEQPQYHIGEENGWIKVIDSLLSQIPLVGIFSGYFFNPSYVVTDRNGQIIARLKKEKSFWGRRFEITKLIDFDQDDAERIMLSLMMMILLERNRG
jgi:uncharacterized protein YxjI